MGKLVQDDGWRLPGELWERMEPLLPERPAHLLGCHNPRVPDRAAMDAIFFVLWAGSSSRPYGRRGSVRRPPLIGASASGSMLGCSKSSGANGCWLTML